VVSKKPGELMTTFVKLWKVMNSFELNRAKGPLKVFIPLRECSFPDRKGLPHWESEGL
jgi:hypothetical protein